MDADFNYQSVPVSFVHCLKGECKFAADCLRYQITLCMPADRPFVTVVNPGSIQADGENCPHFREDKKIRFAYGMTHLYDALPYKLANTIKRQLYNYFGRSMYYRIRNKERAITPQEQTYIQTVFEKQGVEEKPLFDEYREQYDW